MLSESLRVPYRADDAFGTLLVGSVLTLLAGLLVVAWAVLLVAWFPVGLAVTPVVALPSLVVRGYLLAVVDGGIHEEPALSSFVRWGSLIRAGSQSAFISVVYALPGAVLCGLALGGGVATATAPPDIAESVQALTGIVILVAGFGLLIYALVYLYLRPAARAVFAATGSVRAAVGSKRVVRLAATGDYLTGWLIAMGILVAGPTVILPLFAVGVAVGYVSPTAAIITLLAAVLLSIPLAFVCRVSAAWATGRGAADGLGRLYPVAMAPTETGVVVTPRRDAEPLPGAKTRREPSSVVQTGRTVRPGDPTPTAEPTPADGGSAGSTGDADRPAPDADTVPTDADGVDTNTARSDTGPLASDGEEADDTTEPTDDTAEPTDDATEPTDDATEPTANDDHGFVWGDDQE